MKCFDPSSSLGCESGPAMSFSVLVVLRVGCFECTADAFCEFNQEFLDLKYRLSSGERNRPVGGGVCA